MNWKPHINYIANKLSRTNGILYRLKNFLPTLTLKTIYNSLFLSHINYCISCWGFGSLARLTTLQKKAIRTITKSKYNAHTNPIFEELFLLKIEDIFKLNCLKIYHKFHNNSLPNYFHDFPFALIEDTPRERPRRNVVTTLRYSQSQELLPILNPLIYPEETQKKYTRACVRHFIPKLVNENYLAETVLSSIHSQTLYGFSTYSKIVLIKNYDLECVIPNCYICNRQTN